jgi:hypothetical protein
MTPRSGHVLCSHTAAHPAPASAQAPGCHPTPPSCVFVCCTRQLEASSTGDQGRASLACTCLRLGDIFDIQDPLGGHPVVLTQGGGGCREARSAGRSAGSQGATCCLTQGGGSCREARGLARNLGSEHSRVHGPACGSAACLQTNSWVAHCWAGRAWRAAAAPRLPCACAPPSTAAARPLAPAMWRISICRSAHIKSPHLHGSQGWRGLVI